MDKKLVIIIILVLIVGLMGGYILATSIQSKNQDYNNTTTNNSFQNNSSQKSNQTTNQTALNKTKNSTESTDDEKPMISAKKAMKIATYTLRGYDVKGKGAELTTGKNGKPIWIVYLFNPDGSSAGSCAVDASTGKFLG